ncbi:MAG: hypothetical protein U9O86_03240 [Campylobacterota bacterium]|nr:hypothetical protein [Campylobacterota bacterium]
MPVTHANVVSLLEYVKIDSFSVICYFKCKETNKSIISSVPFEPYEGSMEFTWKDLLFHPFKSYERYYHTPITIYSEDVHETIVLKAFLKVSNSFKWSKEKNSYIFV